MLKRQDSITFYGYSKLIICLLSNMFPPTPIYNYGNIT